MPDQAETILIEADSVESALHRLNEEYGSGAKIVSAERVRRGGIGGFFATEGIELVAIPPAVGTPPPEQATSAMAPTAAQETGDGVESVFAQLLEVAERGDSSPMTAMVEGPPPEVSTRQPRLGVPSLPPAPTATVTVTEPDLVQTPKPRQVVSGRHWDVSRLIQAGLPGAIIGQLTALDPADDIAHIGALAVSLQEITGDVPPGAHRLIGERAPRLMSAAGLAEGDGPLHVVLDESRDQFTTARPPQIVSWTHESAAPRAIALALQTGAVLGWGMSSTFASSAIRLTAIDAAIAIRNLMETS